jgi:hypothetical protein
VVIKDVKKSDLYSYRVMWSEEDGEFIGYVQNFQV